MFTVCDISALARWGEQGLAQRLEVVDATQVPWTLASAGEVTPEALRRARLEATRERPLHVLVDCRERRLRVPHLVCHVCAGPLPEGSLYRLSDEALLVSPSLCLRQLSARASLTFAAAAGFEICGEYGCSPHAENGFYQRAPLCSVAELRSRIEKDGGYGAGKALQALDYVVAGARSPMEAALVLLFVLPQEVGGCGLPLPEVNLRIEISPQLQAALGKAYLVADICWPAWRIILEYDSALFHDGARETAYTRSRNEGLADEGWMVRSVSAGLLADDALRRNLVEKVMARAGRELPGSWAYDALQHDLVQRLLSRKRAL